ncbi:uncharacterized protein LAESUDRAFT_721333 [Laetiporus sulphureus 93-53]|uniref:Uncharacterized protein n=1 Tax=Laetiporus sulphureus 93-53 TaxID=1314785 RepID=A0A165GWP1_9APHY|nr:uncharacterized protein LAESUDRAFT_721333 [Laetiporus sulphureus 93-53]KZT10929.1 hypothetical protein LAESUDRAFT_721333 [Laetiporus sulphureus 93-53]
MKDNPAAASRCYHMWDVVDAACEDLIVDLGQAESTIVRNLGLLCRHLVLMHSFLLQTQPAPYEANLGSARSVYGVLIECMRAYAQNRPPVF